jgi:hypothetical protein
MIPWFYLSSLLIAAAFISSVLDFIVDYRLRALCRLLTRSSVSGFCSAACSVLAQTAGKLTTKLANYLHLNLLLSSLQQFSIRSRDYNTLNTLDYFTPILYRRVLLGPPNRCTWPMFITFEHSNWTKLIRNNLFKCHLIYLIISSTWKIQIYWGPSA